MAKKTEAKATDTTRIVEAIKVLMQYGLPNPTSQFVRDMDRMTGRPETPINPKRVHVPLPSASWIPCAVDLRETAPEDIIAELAAAAWRCGLQQGRDEAERDQAQALVDAFPRLKNVIQEVAEEVADKKIHDFRMEIRD